MIVSSYCTSDIIVRFGRKVSKYEIFLEYDSCAFHRLVREMHGDHALSRRRLYSLGSQVSVATRDSPGAPRTSEMIVDLNRVRIKTWGG